MAVSNKAKDFCKGPLYVVNNPGNVHFRKVGRTFPLKLKDKVEQFVEFMDGGFYKVTTSMHLQPFDKGDVVGSKSSNLFGLAPIYQCSVFGCRIRVSCGNNRNALMSVTSLIEVECSNK